MVRLCDYESDFKHPDQGVSFHYFNNNYNDLHTHNYWEVFLMTDGALSQTINDKEISLKKGDCCLIRPSDVHEFICTSQYSQHINLMVTDNILYDMLKPINRKLYSTLLNNKESIFFQLNLHEYSTMNMMIEQLYNSNKNMPTATIIKYFILDSIKLAFSKGALESRDSNNENCNPKWLNLLLEKMNTSSNLYLSLTQICEDVNFSQIHINRLFKLYMGTTIGSYYNNIKMKYARKLLETTNFTMLDICSRIGYSSLSHFTRIFKEKFNATPKEYRLKQNVIY